MFEIGGGSYRNVMDVSGRTLCAALLILSAFISIALEPFAAAHAGDDDEPAKEKSALKKPLSRMPRVKFSVGMAQASLIPDSPSEGGENIISNAQLPWRFENRASFLCT